MIFYRPFHSYRLSAFIGNKVFNQDNEFLPESLKLSEKELEHNLQKKLAIGKVAGTIKNLPKMLRKDDHDEKKLEIANVIIKNGEENLELIDELKTNIMTNYFLEQRLAEFQRKLLPLALVNKRAKEAAENKLFKKEKQEKDIHSLLKKFKEKKIEENESEEVKKIREFILKNTKYIEDEFE